MTQPSGKRFSWLMPEGIALAPYSVEPATYRAGRAAETSHTAALVGRIEGLVRVARSQDDEEVTQRLSRLLVAVASRESWSGRGLPDPLIGANDP